MLLKRFVQTVYSDVNSYWLAYSKCLWHTFQTTQLLRLLAQMSGYVPHIISSKPMCSLFPTTDLFITRCCVIDQWRCSAEGILSHSLGCVVKTVAAWPFRLAAACFEADSRLVCRLSRYIEYRNVMSDVQSALLSNMQIQTQH